VSALAEALVAAQRRALSAMEKQYAAGRLDGDQARLLLASIGLTDDVDVDRLLSALNVIREFGAPLPAEPSNGAPAEKAPDKITDAQATLIGRMWQEQHRPPGDKPILTGLTKADASRLIDQLKTDTYNVADWDIPF
jgi:hypothetical protein